MAYTAPNTFSNGAVISSTDVQANIDALKEYLNGDVAAGDISNTEFVEPRHIMKGLYHPTENKYEMVSGVYIGTSTSDLPTFNPGYAGSYLASFSDSRVPIPGTGISFYLEHGSADVVVNISIAPRGLAVDDAEKQFRFDFRLDESTNNYSSFFGAKETSPESSGAGNDIPGCYRRRSYNVSTTFTDVSAGNHEIRIYCSSDDRAIPLTNYSYTVKAYYQL